LVTPLQTFRTSGYRPYFETNLIIDGNTAHSTAWWWRHAGAFYFGGDLYYNNNGILEYNPGKNTFGQSPRSPCKKDPCSPTAASCHTSRCTAAQQSWLRITNTKTFLNAGVGLVSDDIHISFRVSTLIEFTQIDQYIHFSLRLFIFFDLTYFSNVFRIHGLDVSKLLVTKHMIVV
jgi:hypothetical protein